MADVKSVVKNLVTGQVDVSCPIIKVIGISKDIFQSELVADIPGPVQVHGLVIKELILVAIGVGYEVIAVQSADTEHSLSAGIGTVGQVRCICCTRYGPVDAGRCTLCRYRAAVDWISESKCRLSGNHATGSAQNARCCHGWCSSKDVRARDPWIDCPIGENISRGISFLDAALG